MLVISGYTHAVTDEEVQYEPAQLSGDTLYVGGWGPGNYSTVQEAIYAAHNGDRIFVFAYSSPYVENLVVDRSVIIEGENKETTVLDGNNYPVLRTYADNVHLKGFTFIGGIFSANDNNTVEDNIFTDGPRAILVGNDYNLIQNNTIIDVFRGIELSGTNTTILNNYIDSKNEGMTVNYAKNALIKGNIIKTPSEVGIKIFDQWGVHTNNTVSYNVISGGGTHGIRVESSQNIIHHNTIIDNKGHGISVYEGDSNSADDNEIFSNTIINNGYGIHISSTSGNRKCTDNHMYHNNFINNPNQAFDADSNYWDNGYPDGGNYWKDYMGFDNYSGPGQNQSGSDGIGDTPYLIPGGNNADHYPLMHPIEDTESPQVTIISPEEKTLYIFNKEIQEFITTLIIFRKEIMVNASDYLSGVAKVEFYIDDSLEAIVESEPYSWTWKKWVFFKHTITVIAYDYAENTASDEITVWKFF